jgi:vacuolar-type H+-ATPase subunit F/Vma7
MRGEQDTVTGLLLAGVGNVDARKNTNFLIVDNSMHPLPLAAAFGLGFGTTAGTTRRRADRGGCAYTETTTAQVEAAFKSFTSRADIAILLISQFVRAKILTALCSTATLYSLHRSLPSYACAAAVTLSSRCVGRSGG